jgi:uncharacterized protein (UPF0332 family)
MSEWRDISTDSMAAAKLLLDAGHHRSSVSRAYYCAYAAATAAMESMGLDVGSKDRPNPGHEQLGQMLRHNLDPGRFGRETRRDIARRFRNLLRSRITADYDPGWTVDERLARLCVRDASVILEAMRS